MLVDCSCVVQSIFWRLHCSSITEETSLYRLIILARMPTLAQKKARPSSQMKTKVLFPLNSSM